MRLPPEQIARFYRVWFALLHFVNKRLNLVPLFPDYAGERNILPDDAMTLRNALWEDDALRAAFIAENPADLPEEDLALVASWQYRVAGNFFIVRHLKKYSVFLTEKSPVHAYGALGLVSPIEELTGGLMPVYVNAVLLPFEDSIIYDSLLTPYSIYFGPGIRGSLNDTYRNAQEREGVITRLGPGSGLTEEEGVRKGIVARNALILKAFKKDLAKRGLSLAMVEKHAGNIETFSRDYLLAQKPPRGLLALTVEDLVVYLPAAREKTAMTSFKRFVRFLDETDRGEYEDIRLMSEYLKHAGE